MKTIRYLLYMMLLLPNIEVLNGSYSIDSFLDYLQEKGYYDLIQSVKIYFKDDVAIDICKELTGSNDCEEVVKVYMTSDTGSGSGNGKHGKMKPSIDPEIEQQMNEILKYFEDKYNINKEMKELIEIIISYYHNLIQNMNKEDIIYFIERIIKNPDILEILIK